MQCPACKDVTLVMSDRQGVEVDYCPQCRGVWLDRGELDKIIERSSSFTASREIPGRDRRDPVAADSGFYDEDYRHQDQRRRKKRGFLGELFDFD